MQSLDEMMLSAANGDLDAARGLGDHFADGSKGEHSPSKAMAWYRKAADLGCVESMRKIGVFYRNGELGVDRDDEEGMAWLTRAADLGDAESAIIAGRFLLDNPPSADQKQRAISYIKQAAAGGIRRACRDLFDLYSDEKEPVYDISEANKWLELGAKMGSPTCQYFYGMTLLEAGEEQRQKVGLNYVKKSAIQGNDDAQAQLGYLYHSGMYNVEVDVDKARYWMGLAAANGNGAAELSFDLFFPEHKIPKIDKPFSVRDWLKRRE